MKKENRLESHSKKYIGLSERECSDIQMLYNVEYYDKDIINYINNLKNILIHHIKKDKKCTKSMRFYPSVFPDLISASFYQYCQNKNCSRCNYFRKYNWSNSLKYLIYVHNVILQYEEMMEHQNNTRNNENVLPHKTVYNPVLDPEYKISINGTEIFMIIKTLKEHIKYIKSL